MRIDEEAFKRYESLQEIVRCALLHSRGEKNIDIAKRLDITSVRVTRNLQEARNSGIMRIEVTPPSEQGVAVSLLERYERKNLREVYVYFVGVAEELTNMLGKLAAFYLANQFKNGEISRIAIGPGSTMLAFVEALSGMKRPSMVEVGSTTSATHAETYIASNTIVGMLAAKWKCHFYRFDPDASAQFQRDHADALILGIGKIPDMEGATAKALMSVEGVDEDVVNRELLKLGGKGGVGFINYQPIDTEGKPIDWDMPEYRDTMKLTLLRLDVLRDMAAEQKKKVICIAGGPDKVRAIRVALKGGFFNVLITDYETAVAVLEE